jgi:hypothetical protein
LRELAVVVGDLISSFAARSGEGNSRGWCRVDTMMYDVSKILFTEKVQQYEVQEKNTRVEKDRK